MPPVTLAMRSFDAESVTTVLGLEVVLTVPISLYPILQRLVEDLRTNRVFAMVLVTEAAQRTCVVTLLVLLVAQMLPPMRELREAVMCRCVSLSDLLAWPRV